MGSRLKRKLRAIRTAIHIFEDAIIQTLESVGKNDIEHELTRTALECNIPLDEVRDCLEEGIRLRNLNLNASGVLRAVVAIDKMREDGRISEPDAKAILKMFNFEAGR